MAILKQLVPEIFPEDVFAPLEGKIEYWLKEMPNYFCHLFVIEINEEIILSNIWEVVSARLAMQFQITLPVDIEMYNIYLVFLFKQKISKELKYKIEQDKYCCRKLVEDELGEVEFTDDYITNLIEDKIFTLNTIEIETSMVSIIESSVDKIINARDKNILISLKDYQSSNTKISLFYNNFLKLSDE